MQSTTAGSVTATAFRVEAIPGDVLERVRETGVDDLGNEMVTSVTTEAGAPLRCCLREAGPGERIALIGYLPFPWDGAYAETGPVLIHADECPGYTAADTDTDAGAYPEGFRHRQQIFRAYGYDHTIVDAEIVEGADAEQAIAGLLARPEVDFVHSRNVAYGCFMFAIHRA
jgi:hypothetical protein